MIIETLSTFPEMFNAVMGASIMKRAQEHGIVDFTAYDLRDWTHDRHRSTDDSPYGGGAGLVMKCEPIFEAFQDITGIHLGMDFPRMTGNEQPRTGPLPRHRESMRPYTIFLTPCGTPFTDRIAQELSQQERLLFICGHYEGIDERTYELADCQISLGDYVLTSGELAALVVIDALVRKIEGVLGASDGADDESFAHGLLEYPQYTRPANFYGRTVPEVLLSGNHAAIERWRLEQSIERTQRLRPDLLATSMPSLNL